MDNKEETVISKAPRCHRSPLELLEVVKFIRKLVIERLGKDAFVKMLNRPNKDGETTLYLAANYGSAQLVEYLMSLEECDHAIACKSWVATPLHIAVLHGNLDVVKRLLEAPRFTKDEKLRREYLDMKFERRNSTLHTPFHIAKTYKKFKVLEVSLTVLSLFFTNVCANE